MGIPNSSFLIPKSRLQLFRLFFAPTFSGAKRALPLKLFERAVGTVVASTTKAGFSRNQSPFQHISAHFLEEVAQQFCFLMSQGIDDGGQKRRLVAFIFLDEPLTTPCCLQQNDATIRVRSLAPHQTQFFEPIEILAARSGRYAETTRKFTHLEIGVRRDELQKTELRSSQSGPANPVEKTLFEELA
jgi:hypothetical protein